MSNVWSFFILGLAITNFYLDCVSGESPRCRFQEFRCLDGSACLASEKLCNGVEDCPQGEDERGNLQWDCSRISLNTDCGDQHKFFKCRFGGCVPRSSVCNGVLDCWGGTDESTNLCGETGLRPAPNVIPGARPVPNPNRPDPQPTRQRPAPPAQTAPRPAPRPQQTPRPQFVQPYPAPPPQSPRPAGLPPQSPRPTASPASGASEEQLLPLAPEQPQAKPCLALEPEEGIRVKCVIGKRLADCEQPLNGTIATLECKSHYSPTQNAPRTTRRMCRNGKWTRRNPKWNCNLECGVGGREVAQFIIGGVTSSIGKWPWHVGFYHQDPPGSGNWEYFCGGTMISAKTVVTAAHCVTSRDGRPRTDIRLFFGKFYRDVGNNDEFVQERRVGEIHVNDYYNSQTFSSDIAMVALDQALDITDRVRPACLPNDVDIESGDIGALVGWGRFSDNSYPQELQEARLPVITFKNCQKAHPSLEALVKADTFCAGYRNGTSPCDGDSGSGLVSTDSTGNRWIIYGIVSAGVAKRGGGCDPKYYTVFTRVFKFRPWIDNHLDTGFKRRRRSMDEGSPLYVSTSA